MNQHCRPLSTPTQPISDSFFKSFPSTRYQGSKRKLLPFLFSQLSDLPRGAALDLYSGTASVSLLLRSMKYTVCANDYLSYNHHVASFFLNTTADVLSCIDINSLLSELFDSPLHSAPIVSENYQGVFFLNEENIEIDRFCQNLPSVPQDYHDLLIYLMGQAMLMKRPYNLFHRANLDMRTRTVKRSFGNARTWATPFRDHMCKLFTGLQKFPFSGPLGHSTCLNTLDLDRFDIEPDLIYLDPPYLNRAGTSVNYADFYHFLEGLVDYRRFLSGDTRFAHRPIAPYETAWRSGAGGLEELSRVCARWPKATIALSYRGDGQPSIDEIRQIFSDRKYSLSENFSLDYKYALSKNDLSTEELIIAFQR